jgi:DnaJ-class molecular chaperone
MASLCRRCGGSGWLLRNPAHMTVSQHEMSSAYSVGFGRWFTICTDCGGSGLKGIKKNFPT